MNVYLNAVESYLLRVCFFFFKSEQAIFNVLSL